ncbi:MAG: heme A synthase [Gemmatimonadales bacterium]|nr:MAG: heme A synthase [Gemmatimonadales bacterium]
MTGVRSRQRRGATGPVPPPTPHPMSESRFRPFAWGVFIYGFLVIQWGYFLRISESGDGCGTDWPLCHGAVVPDAPPFATFVEFTHRLTSGIVLLLVILMAIWAFRAFPRGAPVRKAAGAALLFTITESLFGAVLVVLGWVAGDVSTGRILIRPIHVTNTFLLLGALAATAWWARRPPGTPLRPLREALRPAALPILGVLALGWTGSWTGLAATAFPHETLAEGMGQYVDPEHILIWLRMSHPVLALAVIWFVVRMARRTGPGEDSVRQGLARAAAVLALVQLVVGPATILLLNPIWTRLGHLVLGDLLWVALVWLVAERMGSTGRNLAAPVGEEEAAHARTRPHKPLRTPPSEALPS